MITSQTGERTQVDSTLFRTHIPRCIKKDSELFLERRVEFRELKIKKPEDYRDDGIRLYGGDSCAVLQFRGVGSTNDGKGGKIRRMIATASYLDAAECDALIERLIEIRKNIYVPTP